MALFIVTASFTCNDFSNTVLSFTVNLLSRVVSPATDKVLLSEVAPVTDNSSPTLTDAMLAAPTTVKLALISTSPTTVKLSLISTSPTTVKLLSMIVSPDTINAPLTLADAMVAVPTTLADAMVAVPTTVKLALILTSSPTVNLLSTFISYALKLPYSWFFILLSLGDEVVVPTAKVLSSNKYAIYVFRPLVEVDIIIPVSPLVLYDLPSESKPNPIRLSLTV